MTIPALMPVYPRCGVRPVRGEGVYLYGEHGEQYLDFAVFALVERHREPAVGTAPAIDNRADRTIANAVDRDAVC